MTVVFRLGQEVDKVQYAKKLGKYKGVYLNLNRWLRQISESGIL